MHFLALLKTAFSLWMLVDAAQRRAPYFWYFIIMMPFGELAYFFAVKIHDPQFRSIRKKLSTRRIPLSQLRYNAKNSPSLNNKLLLAQSLHDHGQHQEAVEHFTAVLTHDGADKRALFGLGNSLMQLGEYRRATETLSRLVKDDIGYQQYAAASCLAQSYWMNGERDQAVSFFQDVVKKSQLLEHQTQLASFLVELGRKEEAHELLKRALDDYENSPSFVKKKNKRYARQARTILQG